MLDKQCQLAYDRQRMAAVRRNAIAYPHIGIAIGVVTGLADKNDALLKFGIERWIDSFEHYCKLMTVAVSSVNNMQKLALRVPGHCIDYIDYLVRP